MWGPQRNPDPQAVVDRPLPKLAQGKGLSEVLLTQLGKMFLARCFCLDLTYDLAATVCGLFHSLCWAARLPFGVTGEGGIVNSQGFCLRDWTDHD